MKVKKIPITKIKPYWRNPRKNDGAVASVRLSIENYGFNVPLVVDPNFVIIAGHTRYKAALQLEFDELPCVVLDIDERKAKEYRIADNKTSELASWDYENLMPELRELDIDIMQPFFSDLDLSGMLNPVQMNFEPVTDEEIEEHTAMADERFNEASQTVSNSMVEVTCPDCGHDFFVDRREINRIRTDV